MRSTSVRASLTLILPYMEQQNIYNQINLSLSCFDQLNVPPAVGGSGGLFPGVGQNSVYSIAIAAFICPSDPGPGDDQLLQRAVVRLRQWQRLAGRPTRRPRSGAGWTTSPCRVSIRGSRPRWAIRRRASTALSGSGDVGTICDIAQSLPNGSYGNAWAHVKIASITDGTSNTVMFGEMAARPVGYNHARQIYVQNGGPVDGVINPVNGGGGAWADPFSYAHMNGSLASGIRGYGGTCVINCTTNNELYSFHPGGANFLFADGSVHFIKETINPFTMVGLVTRAMGEVISSDSY